MTKTYRVRVALSERELCAAAIALVVVAVFSNALSGAFVWDDRNFVTDNAYMASWSGLPRLFTQNVVAGAGQKSDLYRPLQSLSHFLDVRVWGYAPWGHHLTSVLWHAAASVAVFFWLAEFAAWPAAAAATGLYALHPLQSEAVAYVSGRGDTMAVFFLCLGLILFRARPRASWLCAAAAVLSKESLALFPVLLLLHDRARGIRAPWRAHAPFWVLSAAYAALRLTVLNFHDTLNFFGHATPFTDRFSYRLCTYLPTLPEGLRLWLWPSDLHHERFWRVYESALEPRVWLSAAGLAAWLAAAAGLRRRAPAVAAGLVWFVAATVPTSNLLVIINALFYDHWFLLPGLGLALAAAAVLPKAGAPRAAALGLCAALCAALAWRTRLQNEVWGSPEGLFRQILRYEPREERARVNLGGVLVEKGDAEGAIEQFQAAVRLSDAHPEAHQGLGQCYQRLGRFAEADAEYARALAMDPGYCAAWVSRGELARKRGLPARAVLDLERALRVCSPQDPMRAEAFAELAETRRAGVPTK